MSQARTDAVNGALAGFVGAGFFGLWGYACHYASGNLQSESKLMDQTQSTTLADLSGYVTRSPGGRTFAEVYGRTWCPTGNTVKAGNGRRGIRMRTKQFEVSEECKLTPKRDEAGTVIGWKKNCRRFKHKVSSSDSGGPVYIRDFNSTSSRADPDRQGGPDPAPVTTMRVDEDSVNVDSLFVPAHKTFEPAPVTNVVVNTGGLQGQGQEQAPPPPTTTRIGYETVQHIIPTNRQVYALGDVRASRGDGTAGLLFGRSAEHTGTLRKGYTLEYGTEDDVKQKQLRVANSLQVVGHVLYGLGAMSFASGASNLPAVLRTM